MAKTSVQSLNNDDYVVIDLDSGTVLGTNLVLVSFPEDEQEREELLNSDTTAFNYGIEKGVPIFVELTGNE